MTLLQDFDLNIVNFPFLDGDVPRRPSYGLYTYIISKLVCFATESSHATDFKNCNNLFTAKLLKQLYG